LAAAREQGNARWPPDRDYERFSITLSQEELLDKVKSSRVPVYGIGLLSENDPQRQDAARLALGELADASGGLAPYPKNVAEVESVSRQIANEAGKR
jgi:hypothetical protein